MLLGVYFSSYTVPDLLLNSMGLRELPSAWWGWYALSQRHKGAPCPCRGCDNVCCCCCGDDYLPARIPDPSWEVCTVPPSLWELHHRICDLTIPRDPCLGLPPISFSRLSPRYQEPIYAHLVNRWQWGKVMVPISSSTVRFLLWMTSAVWDWTWRCRPVISAPERWKHEFKSSLGYTVNPKVQDPVPKQSSLISLSWGK